MVGMSLYYKNPTWVITTQVEPGLALGSFFVMQPGLYTISMYCYVFQRVNIYKRFQ